MEVRWRMVAAVHADDDPIKTANARHDALRSEQDQRTYPRLGTVLFGAGVSRTHTGAVYRARMARHKLDHIWRSCSLGDGPSDHPQPSSPVPPPWPGWVGFHPRPAGRAEFGTPLRSPKSYIPPLLVPLLKRKLLDSRQMLKSRALREHLWWLPPLLRLINPVVGQLDGRRRHIRGRRRSRTVTMKRTRSPARRAGCRRARRSMPPLRRLPDRASGGRCRDFRPRGIASSTRTRLDAVRCCRH